MKKLTVFAIGSAVVCGLAASTTALAAGCGSYSWPKALPSGQTCTSFVTSKQGKFNRITCSTYGYTSAAAMTRADIKSCKNHFHVPS